MTERTCDDFLGGRVRLWQPARGYRAGVDPVLLAACVEAQPGQTILDLGCGAGAALFCLGARVPGLLLTGVEVQDSYAACARETATLNGAAAEIVTADLRALPDDLRQRSFHHVMMNPPYFDRDRGTGSTDAGRDLAFGGPTALADWIGIGARRVRPKGTLTLVQRIERLPEVLTLLGTVAGHLGSQVVLPVAGRHDRAPDRFLLQVRHGGRAPFHLSPTLVLHGPARHERDGDDYRPEVGDILRNASALSIRR